MIALARVASGAGGAYHAGYCEVGTAGDYRWDGGSRSIHDGGGSRSSIRKMRSVHRNQST